MAVQINNLTGLVDIRKMDKVANAWIRELYGVMNGFMKRLKCFPLAWPCGENGE